MGILYPIERIWSSRLQTW